MRALIVMLALLPGAAFAGALGAAHTLPVGHVIAAGDLIPGDGDVVEGMSLADLITESRREGLLDDEETSRLTRTLRSARIRVADVLIGADGQRSVVRQEILGGEPAKPTGWASWQGLTRSDLPVAEGRQTLNIAGRNAHCGLIPTGDGLLHWWFDMPWKEGDRVHTVAELRETFRGWPGPVEALLASVTDDDLGFFPHIRHKVPHIWGGPRSTLLGDAVHAMPPAVAQAANQTLEDAWLLTQCMADADGSPAERLRAYEYERRPRVLKVSRTAALTSAQRRTPIQRIARFPGWLATRSQVASLRSGSNVLRSLSPKPRLRVA